MFPLKVDVAVVEVALIVPTVNWGVPVATRLLPFQETKALLDKADEFIEYCPLETFNPFPAVKRERV